MADLSGCLRLPHIRTVLIEKRGGGRKKKEAGVSSGQQNLHMLAIAVPTGIFYL